MEWNEQKSGEDVTETLSGNSWRKEEKNEMFQRVAENDTVPSSLSTSFCNFVTLRSYSVARFSACGRRNTGMYKYTTKPYRPAIERRYTG